MIELSPYYFSSFEKNHELTISYYPINRQWKIIVRQNKKITEYWLSLDQAINIRDLFIESIDEASDIKEIANDKID